MSATVSIFLLPAPLFLLFELWQLVMGERHAGIKQIERRQDPRETGPGEFTAFCWSSLLFLYWAWLVVLLFQPLGRVHALCLLAVFATGYALRRVCQLKWLLVILTFEGAVRIGLLFSLCVYVWRRW